MHTAHYPMAKSQDLRLKSGRKPLQPKNSLTVPVAVVAKTKSKFEQIEISALRDSKKENRPIFSNPAAIDSCDSSLADELNAVKKKLERLRLDGEQTEKLLRERDVIFEIQMKELLRRGQVQRDMEMEVDRLFRLKELRFYCLRISPIRTLREKEREKISNNAQSQEIELGDEEESIGENSTGNQNSDCSETVSDSELGREL